MQVVFINAASLFLLFYLFRSAKEFKNLYTAGEKVQKQLAKSYPTYQDTNSTIKFEPSLINEVIVQTLVQQGRLQLAEMLQKEIQEQQQKQHKEKTNAANSTQEIKPLVIDERLRFMEEIRIEMEKEHKVEKCLKWVIEQRAAVEKQETERKANEPASDDNSGETEEDSKTAMEISSTTQYDSSFADNLATLHFDLHRLHFLQLLYKQQEVSQANKNGDNTNNPTQSQPAQYAALQYAQQYFPPFHSTRMNDIRQLSGCLLFVSELSVSPYAEYFTSTGQSQLWYETYCQFQQCFYQSLHMSTSQPLTTILQVSDLILPEIQKYQAKLKQNGGFAAVAGTESSKINISSSVIA